MQLQALGQQTQQQAALAPGQLQGQQQQLQQGQIQIQQAQRAEQDQQALTKAMQQWDGKDYTQIPALVIKNGGSANAVFSASQNILGQKEKIAQLAKTDADTNSTNVKAQQDQNDQYRGRLQAVIDAPADQKQQLWDNEVTQEEQSGTIKPGSMSHTYPGDDAATALANHFALGSALAKEASEKMQAEARASTAKVSAERLAAEMPGGALASPDKAELQAWLAKNPGKDAADFLAYKATLAPKAQISVQSGMLEGPAKDMAAENYFQTGQMPQGIRSPAMSSSIINRAAELHPNGTQDLAGNRAAFKANQDSLTGLQKNFDMVTAFENTAGKNLDTYLGAVKKLDDSGSPLLNRPIREVESAAAGNPDIAAANTARTTALTEIAKVLNSSNASGVLSDSARSEVSGLIGPNSTLKQVESAANILKQDMANRHQSYQQQIQDIKGRLGGSQGGGGQTAQPVAPSGSGVTRIKASDGTLHDIPTANLDKARQIDPKLQVIQ